MLRYIALLIAVVALGGCVVQPIPGPDDPQPEPITVSAESVAHDAVVAYSVLCADAYIAAAEQLEAGTLTGDRETRDFLAGKMQAARDAAFQPVLDLQQQRIGVTDSRPWDAAAAAALFRQLAEGHRRVNQ